MIQFRVLVYIITLFCTNLINAQAPEIEWQRSIGSDSWDAIGEIIQTDDGGYILAATSTGGISDQKTEVNHGSGDYWLIKTDQTGQIQWQNTIGGSGSDGLVCIDITSDGGYILGGNSSSNISWDKSENAIGPLDLPDYWVVKVDSLGAIQWQNTIGGSDEDLIANVFQTIDGGYIVGGYSSSDASGDKTENSIGGIDFWVLKLDNLGNIVWQSSIGGYGDDVLTSIIPASDGRCLAGGYSFSGISGDKTEPQVGWGTPDYWVVELDTLGNIVWQNTIGGSGYDNLMCMTGMPDGGFVLAGSSYSSISGDKTESSIAGTNDYWIVKINATGIVEWDNTINGNEEDIPYSVVPALDGGIYIGGRSKSGHFADKMEQNMGEEGNNYDYWIMKLDPSGILEWENTFGCHQWDYLSSVTVASDGSCVAAGQADGVISRDKTVSGAWYSQDIWLIKLFPTFICASPPWSYVENITATSAKLYWTHLYGADNYQISYRPTVGGAWLKAKASSSTKVISGLIPETEYEYRIRTKCDGIWTTWSPIMEFVTTPLRLSQSQEFNALQIYPNPAKDQFHIAAKVPDQVLLLEIYSYTGQCIYTQTIYATAGEINETVVLEAASGLYIARLASTHMDITEQLIIE